MHLYAGKKHANMLIESCPVDTLLHAMGVRAGLRVKIVTKQPMGGPIVIRVDKRDIALDQALAKTIIAKAVL